MSAYKKYIGEIEEQGFTIIPKVLDGKAINIIKKNIKLVLIETLSNITTEEEQKIFKKKDIDFLYNFLKEKSPKLKAHSYDILSKLALITNSVNNKKLYSIAQNYLKGAMITNASQLRIDDPSDDRILPWHQELEQMSLITLNVWMPLVNISKNTGGISIIPKSHKYGLQKHIVNKKLSAYYHLPNKITHQEEKISLTLNAGDAVVFHSFLFHKSTNNKSTKNRWTIVSRYNQLSTMPYLKSSKAKMFMNRNPKQTESGHSFLKKFKINNRK